MIDIALEMMPNAKKDKSRWHRIWTTKNEPSKKTEDFGEGKGHQEDLHEGTSRRWGSINGRRAIGLHRARAKEKGVLPETTSCCEAL